MRETSRKDGKSGSPKRSAKKSEVGKSESPEAKKEDQKLIIKNIP